MVLGVQGKVWGLRRRQAVPLSRRLSQEQLGDHQDDLPAPRGVLLLTMPNLRTSSRSLVAVICLACAGALSVGLLGASITGDEVVFMFLLALMAGHSLSASP
jgi:hypothetical protein